MNPNSRAYRDAWKRIRDAIESEAVAREICLTDAALDDMACEAAHAAFGMDDDDQSVVQEPSPELAKLMQTRSPWEEQS